LWPGVIAIAAVVSWRRNWRKQWLQTICDICGRNPLWTIFQLCAHCAV